MTARDRRAVALGVVVIVVGVAVTRVLPWGLTTWRGATDRLAAERALLARVETELAQQVPLADSLRGLREALVGLGPRLISAARLPEAVDELSQQIRELTAGPEVALDRIEPVPGSGDGREGAFQRVALRVQLRTDTQGLTDLLRRFVDHPIAMNPAALRITPEPPSPVQPEVLRVDVTIEAWHLPRVLDAAGSTIEAGGS